MLEKKLTFREGRKKLKNEGWTNFTVEQEQVAVGELVVIKAQKDEEQIYYSWCFDKKMADGRVSDLKKELCELLA